MTHAEIKLDLCRRIEALNNAKIQHLYGSILNLFNEEETFEGWDFLSSDEQSRIMDSENQYKSGKCIPHDHVMTKHFTV